MWKPFLETHFFGKRSREIISSPIQNLFILYKENNVKFRREKLTKFWLVDIRYVICGMYLVDETYFYMIFY